MDIETYSWEEKLLSRAYEPLCAGASVHTGDTGSAADESLLLERALAHCAAVTKEHSRTFHLASSLLPAQTRRSIRALYAFCRVTDDLVDRASGDARDVLNAWRGKVLGPVPPEDDLVAFAWSHTMARHAIPVEYAVQLIDGVAEDLNHQRYSSFDELADYAYSVASTVGLMAMHIVGFTGPEAVPFAVRLGVALQLTNILRDVGEDWAAGRLYLPLEELESFGLGEQDIAERRADDRWLAFMRFQISRACRLYAEALPGIAHLAPDGRFAIAAAAELYRAILYEIRESDGDVFHRRVYVKGWQKASLLPGIWWRSRTLSYAPVAQGSC
jgi:phytoene synthase